MKKLFGVIIMLVYLFSVNSLVHSTTIGFFANHTNSNTIHSCHGKTMNNATERSPDLVGEQLTMNNDGNNGSNKSKTQDIDCCELVYSNQYNSIKTH